MYEELYKCFLKEKDLDMAMCSYKEIYKNTDKVESGILLVESNLKQLKVYRKDEIMSSIVSTFTENENYGYYSLCNKLYSKKFLTKNKLKISESREHGEDWLFNIEAFVKMNSCMCIKGAYYNYIHQNKNSLMFKYRDNQFELITEGRKKLFEIIEEKYINYKALDERYIYEFSSYILAIFDNMQRGKNRKNKIYNIIKNEEVKKASKNSKQLGLHYRIITKLIATSKVKSAYFTYKLLYLGIKKKYRF